ncbi:ricin-type beta-trefoil lectin protein [Pseudosporangium ferrugineum]|uniref:Ricin-type beta-trefoil lectin protein n=2 Tax=Pseudosporangium ferrugineum TaxID=439699 RepID=A0A2T0SFF5_9ACTN|nr:ricin-type beta-trefoil lectin protein [Pseudosporangium ferrugineum]
MQAVQTTCDYVPGQYWPDQYWQLLPVGSAYLIHSPLLNLCLTARGSGESAAVATTCGGWNDQLWRWRFNSDSTEQFENVNSGLCLTARGSGESAAVATSCDWKQGRRWADQHWITF